MSDISTELSAAAEGLLYPSESDEPFVAFSWPLLPNQTAQQAIEQHVDGKQPVVEQSVDEFFADLVETDDVDRYAALHKLVVARLAGVSVFRVGKIQVGVFLIGRACDAWVGLRTLSIET